MTTRFAFCLGLAATCLAAMPVPASAQALLPPYEITTSVRSMGLEPISSPVRRGARYVLRAIDGRGTEVRVAADALDGRILFVRPVGHGRGPVYAERSYPDVYYPEEIAPPRIRYERQPPRNPGEPSVIYAPRNNVGAQAPVRAPSAAKPPLPKVAAKPPAEPAAPVETPAPEQSSADTSITGSTPPSPPENPALAVPPVQGLE